MAYSNVGIANLALGRIGVSKISVLTEKSDQSIAVNAVWEYIRDEVLSAKDWVFATRRVALAQSVLEPIYNYSYAYALPTDFLRLAKQKKDDPSVYYAGSSSELSTMLEEVYQVNWSYVFETLTDGNLYLLSNYDNTDYDIYIKYIRQVIDPAKYSPSFISAFAFRLAAEVSIPLTESLKKFESMLTLYNMALQLADGLNQSMNYEENETGTDDWDKAGR